LLCIGEVVDNELFAEPVTPVHAHATAVPQDVAAAGMFSFVNTSVISTRLLIVIISIRR